MRIDAPIITGSFSLNGDTFNDLGAYPSTGSNTFIGNQSIVGAVSASALTGSINYTNLTNVPTLVSGSEQIVGILSPLNSFSASVDALNITQNTRLSNLEEKTGSLATTGSNTFYGTQVFSGSLYVKENLIVQGSSSLQNITASAVDIGTNKIILNVDNPSVRYAGISVYDSGSTSGTGSLFWDSVNNYWLYEHPADSGAPYNSAILISGPKNEGNLGEESGLVANYITKAVGGDHISSSAIIDVNGNIGIGIESPGYKLQIVKNADTYVFGINGGASGTTYYANYLGDGGASLGTRSNHSLAFFTNDTDRLTITNGGDILIKGNGKFLQAVRNTGGATIDILGIQSGTDTLQIKGGTSGASNAINFYDTGGLIGTFYNSNLGIGVTNPTQKLQSGGRIRVSTDNSNGGDMAVDDGGLAFSTIGSSPIAFWTSNYTNQRMRITSGGSVGIGTASPDAKLEVADATNSVIKVTATSDGAQAALSLNGYASGGTYRASRVNFQQSGTNKWSIIQDYNQNNTNSLTFEQAGSPRIIFDSNANVTMGNTSISNDSGLKSLTLYGSGGDNTKLSLAQIWNTRSYPVNFIGRTSSIGGSASNGLSIQTSYWNGSSVSTADRLYIDGYSGNTIFKPGTGANYATLTKSQGVNGNSSANISFDISSELGVPSNGYVMVEISAIGYAGQGSGGMNYKAIIGGYSGHTVNSNYHKLTEYVNNANNNATSLYNPNYYTYGISVTNYSAQGMSVLLKINVTWG